MPSLVAEGVIPVGKMVLLSDSDFQMLSRPAAEQSHRESSISARIFSVTSKDGCEQLRSTLGPGLVPPRGLSPATQAVVSETCMFESPTTDVSFWDVPRVRKKSLFIKSHCTYNERNTTSFFLDGNSPICHIMHAASQIF